MYSIILGTKENGGTIRGSSLIPGFAGKSTPAQPGFQNRANNVLLLALQNVDMQPTECVFYPCL